MRYQAAPHPGAVILRRLADLPRHSACHEPPTVRSVDHFLRSVSAREPRCGSTRVVAIDGPSGSGKSSLADRLADASGALVLRTDAFVPGWRGLERMPATLAHELLEPLSRDEVARPRRWDWERGRWGEPLVVEPTSLLVLDGCGSGSRVLRPHLTALVWLDAPTEVRKERALARDGETFAPWWDTWAEQEARLFAAEGTRDAADVRREEG